MRLIAQLKFWYPANKAEQVLRDHWLEQLWVAVQNDNMPYIEALTSYWGDIYVAYPRLQRIGLMSLSTVGCQKMLKDLMVVYI